MAYSGESPLTSHVKSEAASRHDDGRPVKSIVSGLPTARTMPGRTSTPRPSWGR